MPLSPRCRNAWENEHLTSSASLMRGGFVSQDIGDSPVTERGFEHQCGSGFTPQPGHSPLKLRPQGWPWAYPQELTCGEGVPPL